ncbi:MAG TPA: divalent-cation tolerance protein CutA [Blastocatellia bacterium]|nr:divalent-cation tolerance protein CutA [Blastocatellia bacterium]
MNHELLVLVTTPNEEEARRVAMALVEGRLAACVNIVPAIESVYRWEGKITHDSETLMIIKTTSERYPDLERRVKELHSYSTPEVIALRLDRGSEQYLNWLRDSVADPEAE